MVGDRVIDDGPYPVGYVIAGRKITVQMSDGTVRTDRDEGLTAVERNYVVLDGRKMYFRAGPRPVSAVDSGGVFASSPVEPVASLSSATPETDVVQANEWSASTGAIGIPSGRIGR